MHVTACRQLLTVDMRINACLEVTIVAYPVHVSTVSPHIIHLCTYECQPPLCTGLGVGYSLGGRCHIVLFQIA